MWPTKKVTLPHYPLPTTHYQLPHTTAPWEQRGKAYSRGKGRGGSFLRVTVVFDFKSQKPHSSLATFFLFAKFADKQSLVPPKMKITPWIIAVPSTHLLTKTICPRSTRPLVHSPSRPQRNEIRTLGSCWPAPFQIRLQLN